MFKSYLLVALRNISNNRLFSTLNIAGLAIGLSACFLIWQYVWFESNYDSFHSNSDRLYRVRYNLMRGEETARESASNFAATGYAMKTDLPEVVDFCRVVKTSLFTSDLGKYVANALEFSWQNPSGDLVAFNEEKVWFADAPILTMFTFPLVAGKSDALKEPNSIVMTKSVAKKYFGNQAALGKEIRLNRDMVFKVTGVIEDVPMNSHLQFDILISFSTLRPRLGDMYDNWGWSAFYTYVLLEGRVDPKEVESKLIALKHKYIGPETQQGALQTRFQLQPIKDIHLRSQLDDEQSPVSSERTVKFLSILAIFILVVACINYINLSTAKALQRSKEVGLRKTVGATRSQLVTQFLLDTTVIYTFALLLACGIVAASWNSFESLIGKRISDHLFSNDITSWLFVLIVFVAGILVSGIYPALTLSSFNPAKVLKGQFLKSTRGIMLRKAMVSFQYVLAVLLIAGTVTIYLQLNYMRSLDPGFTKDQVVVVEAPAVYDSMAGKKIGYFKTKTLQLPGVKNVTAASDVPGRGVVEGSAILPVESFENASDKDIFVTAIPGIDTSFFSTFEIDMIEGRMFSDNERMTFRLRDKDESIPVIVNERFVKQMKMRDVKDVLQRRLTFWWGPDQRFVKVIGVVKDHHQVSFKERVDPVMYMQPDWHGSKYFAVRLQSDFKPTLAALETIYDEAFPDHPFIWFFLDERFDAQYKDDQQFANVFNVFTVLAIIVTCLGLLGLSVFSVHQRNKEMGIRKVLGASGSAILLLLSKDFMKVLVLSYAITIPIIYWRSENWLENFSSRIPMPWQIYLVPPALLLLITTLTIVVVGAKTVMEAPVRALRQAE
jgi:putative ABC transport system permease protein